MNPAAFRASLAAAAPPAGLPAALEALWWLERGDWERAHACAQDDASAAGAWVHAHLHRVEGDPGNAGYWYRRAGRREAADAPDEERAAIIAALCSAD